MLRNKPFLVFRTLSFFADVNGDGTIDDAFILWMHQEETTGYFYYVVAALKKSEGYIGTNALPLGDRIAPQTTEFRDGKITVNYADRRSDEPFAAEPTVGVTAQYTVRGDRLVEVNRSK